MRRLFMSSSLIILAIGLVVGGPHVAAQAGTARVRVIHAAPDTPPVDVFVDGNRTLTNVGFPTIGEYQNLPAGKHTFAIAPTGKAATDAIITAEATVQSGKAYSVAAIGLGNVTAKVFNDDLSAPAAGKARVRVIHFSPDAPGADVEVVNGPTLVQNLAFGEASSYLDVEAKSYDLRLVAAGASTVIVQLPNTTFQADKVYDVIAAGRLANIQVKSSSTTPVSNSAPSTGAPSAQPMMSNTGSDPKMTFLLSIGLLTILGGLAVRRRVAM